MRYLQIGISILGMGLMQFQWASGANPKDVVINEIAWMGTTASYNDEWIELYNNTEFSINLSGWSLISTDGTPSIALSGIIGGHGYFLLERTNDQTVSDIPADKVYTGALDDTGERLQLKDPSGQVIDEVDCSSKWFSGSKTPRFTMERLHPLLDGSFASSWGTNNGVTRNGHDAGSNPINGTPKSQNSVFDIALPVTLSHFYASVSPEGIALHWQMESQIDILGFHVLRASLENGPYEPLTSFPILIQAQTPFPTSYSFLDRNVEEGKGYWYTLVFLKEENPDTFGFPLFVEFSFPEIGKVSQVSVSSFPNPFNPETFIVYSIPEEMNGEKVRVVIYDLLGKCVKILADEIASSGEYCLQWKGEDDQGRTVPSGIYFCVIESHHQRIAIQKMTKMH